MKLSILFCFLMIFCGCSHGDDLETIEERLRAPYQKWNWLMYARNRALENICYQTARINNVGPATSAKAIPHIEHQLRSVDGKLVKADFLECILTYHNGSKCTFYVIPGDAYDSIFIFGVDSVSSTRFNHVWYFGKLHGIEFL